jgi:hypothetical protein
MTIHLDWGEAESWQQYESVNESVIATTHAAVRCDRSNLLSTLTQRRDRIAPASGVVCATPSIER